MSQLFRSVLARGFLAHRSIPKLNPTTLCAIQSRPINIKSIESLARNSRTYVTSSTPKNFDNTFATKQELGKASISGNQLNYRDNYENERSAEQVGHEDAEPVEYLNEASNYTTTSNGFEKYDLPAELISRMNELGFNTPFEIQEATLEQTLEGRDLVGKAFTGSGKTLAFAIPIITKILNSSNKNSRSPKCLVLSPTRELCLQLQKCIQQLAPSLNTLAVYGGDGYRNQMNAFNGKVDIICATPGRLRDFMMKKVFELDHIETVCLDEADELLTPNFKEQIEDVLEIGNKKQMLMFSATINRNVFDLIKRYMEDPAFIDLTKGQKYKLPSNIEHCLVKSYNKDTAALAKHYLEQYNSEKCIIFCRTKLEAKNLNRKLRNSGVRSSDLHSDFSQYKRGNILRGFRSGHLNVLVATDVAARGLDIPEVNVVMQIGFPEKGIEYYIHRSGRCGRAGRVGTSIFIDDGSCQIDRSIYQLIKFKKLDMPESIPDKVEEENNFDRNRNESQSFGSFKKPRSFNNNYNNRSYDSPRSYNNNYNNRSYDSSPRSFGGDYKSDRYSSNNRNNSMFRSGSSRNYGREEDF